MRQKRQAKVIAMSGSIRFETNPMRWMGVAGLLLVLTACDDFEGFNLGGGSDGADTAASSTSSTLVERDVEAPDVFQVTEAGLWDGRPSLGGVWVAHPDVKDPERVIIRNTTNDKFVIGALFRREREIPGPRLQISSDAAEALGVLAGAPVQLNVTALRRETVAEEPLEPVAEEADTIAEASDVEETTLDPIAGGAAAAIDASEVAAASSAASASAATATAAAAPSEPAPTTRSSLSKPYIQVGIFSVESNATNTANQMRSIGVVPTVLEQSLNGKPFWRVIVGPAQTTSERSALLKQIQGAGFSDADAVSN